MMYEVVVPIFHKGGLTATDALGFHLSESL